MNMRWIMSSLFPMDIFLMERRRRMKMRYSSITDRRTVLQIDRQRDSVTDRQTDRRTVLQIDRQTE